MKTFIIIFILMFLQSCSSTKDSNGSEKKQDNFLLESAGRLR